MLVLEGRWGRKERKVVGVSFEINIPIVAYRTYTTTESTTVNYLMTEENLRAGDWLRKGSVVRRGKKKQMIIFFCFLDFKPWYLTTYILKHQRLSTQTSLN